MHSLTCTKRVKCVWMLFWLWRQLGVPLMMDVQWLIKLKSTRNPTRSLVSSLSYFHTVSVRLKTTCQTESWFVKFISYLTGLCRDTRDTWQTTTRFDKSFWDGRKLQTPSSSLFRRLNEKCMHAQIMNRQLCMDLLKNSFSYTLVTKVIFA